jgi:hypothetical protein
MRGLRIRDLKNRATIENGANRETLEIGEKPRPSAYFGISRLKKTLGEDLGERPSSAGRIAGRWNRLTISVTGV